MAGRKPKQPEYEEREASSRAPLLIVVAVALFGLAILLMYIALAAPQQGTAMGAIRNVMRGLGGSLFVLIPLLLVWGGVLFIFAAKGKKLSVWRILVNLLLVVCLFTAVHLFFAERIVRERMTISGFSNFVAKSYGYGSGGGAVGALIAWPLYRYLGVWGGLIADILIALMCLTATGRAGQFLRWSSQHASEARHRSEQRRTERELEQMFDYDDRSSYDTRVAEASVGRNPNRDPYNEAVISGTNVKPELDNNLRRGSHSSINRADSRSMGQQRPARQEHPVRQEHPARQERPVRQERSNRQARSERTTTADRGDHPVQDIQAAQSQAAEVRPIRNRKKLYNEKVEIAQQAEGVLAPEEEFDDYDMLDAESILNSGEKSTRGKGIGENKRAAKAFKPDRPSVLNDEVEEDAAPEIPVVKADKKTNVRMEDLTIEPDEYELPDVDDDSPPFDIPTNPVKKNAARGQFPKLKRIPVPETIDEEEPEYNYPPIDLLAEGETEDVASHRQGDMEKAKLLEETLQSFGIASRLIGIAHGPAVTRFELQPAPGVKVSRITALADDIALNLAAMSVRIEAPIPGKAAVGVEIPNDKIEMVRLRNVLESSDARRHPSKIAVGLGKDNSGRYIVADIAKMPHVLIAGQTGSGKSVCINAIITSILFRATPEEVRLILIDPKVVELSIYNDIPHLVCPVVTDPKKAASALDWAVAEMSTRYKKFAERGVRDIKGYNKSLQPGEKMMPQMVIIIDELADLMMVCPGEVEDSICRLAQLARAAGMHLVIATQRPSVNVITGIIKANIPTRIAFSVASQVDSRTMIDHGGAEKLLGNGDMLFVPSGINKPMRVQGAWVSDDEVHAIVEYIKQSSETTYDQDMLEHMENAVRTDAEKEEFSEEYDARLPEAVEIVLEAGQASISMLQRRMRVGYARAGRLIDEMAQRGIVSEADGAKPRVVLITREEAEAMFEET